MCVCELEASAKTVLKIGGYFVRAIEYFPFPLSSSRHFEDTTDNEVIVAIEPIDAVDAIENIVWSHWRHNWKHERHLEDIDDIENIKDIEDIEDPEDTQ